MARTAGWTDFIGLVHARTMATRKAVLDQRVEGWDEYLKLTSRLRTAEELLGIPEWAAKVVENEKKRRVENEEPLT